MELELVKASSIIAVGLILFGAAIASSLGVSNVGAKLLEGAARNPSQSDRLQVQAFVMIGTLEAVPMIGIGVAMLLLFANPLA